MKGCPYEGTPMYIKSFHNSKCTCKCAFACLDSLLYNLGVIFVGYVPLMNFCEQKCPILSVHQYTNIIISMANIKESIYLTFLFQ